MDKKKAHLVGIGGIGMSGLANILITKGYSVTGSDLVKNELTENLAKLGAKISYCHDESNLEPSTSLVVKSAAIGDSNPEIIKAKALGIEVLKYSEMLGKIMSEKTGIAISGCHGKTTTTAAISYILSRAALEPSFLCGGVIPQLKGNAFYNEGGKYFVGEACEYDRSFLNLTPRIAVITNIEEDHLDYYKDGISEIVEAFRRFSLLVGEKGFLVGNLDNEYTSGILKSAGCEKETYSIKSQSDWMARNITVKNGKWEFEIVKYGKLYSRVVTRLAGIHNVGNLLAAAAVANHLCIGQELVTLALMEFRGVSRRFDILGEKNGIIVIDDYAHHPTEIQATLRAVKEKFPLKKVWCVFQPHQYARTRIFLKEFAKSFRDADIIIVSDIYAARDKDDEKKVSSRDLVEMLDANGKAALYIPMFDEIIKFLKGKVEPNSVVITLGAGTVGEVARKFLN